MQMARWKLSPEIAQLFGLRFADRFAQMQARLFQTAGPFFQVTFGAGRNHIFPTGAPAARARHHMIKGQIAARTAILARKLIAQKRLKRVKATVLCGLT